MNRFKLSLLGLGIFASTAVFSQENKSAITKEQRMENRMDKFAEDLALTDVQKEQIIELNKTSSAERQKVKSDESLSEETRKAAMKNIQLEKKTKVAKILTEEQFLKLKAMKETQKANHKNQRSGQQINKLAEALELTEDQKAQFSELNKTSSVERKKVKSDESLTEEARKSAMKAIHLDYKAKMAKILTEEQLLKLKAMKKAQKEKY